MNSNQSTDNRFNENDRATLNEINYSVKDLREEINLLKQELNKTKTEITQVKAQNMCLKLAINLNLYNHNELDQYNQHENLRIYGIPESCNKRDDGEDILFQIANKLDIELDHFDIQRVHRLGKKPRFCANDNHSNQKSYG